MEKIDTIENYTVTLSDAPADTLQDCIARYIQVTLNRTLFCNFTFDSYLCWPPTEANTIVRQPCPKLRLSDPSHFASRFCGSSGKWAGRPGNNTGWTNYTSCLPNNVQRVVADIIKDDNKYSIIYATRYLEISGFVLSLICLLTSIYIFTCFTILQNTRTKIHRNLFGAMIAQVLSRLVIYLDQLLNESETGIAYTVCTLFCNFTFDSYLCWPPTEANTIVRQPCPKLRLSDPSHFASRFCGSSGKWAGRPGNNTGWTNYTSCLPNNVQRVVADIIKDDNKYSIIYATRYLEISGFVLSLICLLTSIYIFTCFTILQNTRTKIHRNLFGAMIAQVLSRLVIYLDQLLNESETGIAYTPIVCEICYVILEWAYTSMFSWMLVEGIYLRYLNSDRLMRRFQFNCYCCFAWGMPIVFTVLWTAFTLKNYNNTCWFGYNFENTYWIMQTPRLMVIMINIVILTYILKELYSKLQENKVNTEKIKISIKAALILIPLLGIINILNMIDIPLSTTSWKFAIWSYTTHFLRSFQGAFLAIYYCFLNREVRGTLKRKVKEVTFFDDINERLTNRKRKNTLNDLLAVEPNIPFIVKTAPPPPFFRINADGIPTTKQKCGCSPRFDLHQDNCLLAQPLHFDSDNGQDVNTTPQGDDTIHDNGSKYILLPPKTTLSGTHKEEIVLKMVIRPDIHQPSTRAPPVGITKTTLVEIELKETTV